MLPPLRVDLLGTPVLTMEGRPLTVDTRKASALLAVLAAALADGESPVARERLAALFWPEADDARARASLRRTLSVLLAATGSAVIASREALQLDPRQLTSDVVRFGQLTGSDSPSDWAAASELLRGDFMSGFSLRDCPPFEDWVAARAAVLRRDAGALMERLVRAHLRAGELHAALAGATRWLTLDPLHEPAHRTVMRVLAWTGRRQDALDAYHQCVRVLNDELGVTPVRATTAVFDAIRTGTLAGPPVRPARPAPGRPPVVTPVALPVEAEIPLMGRDSELATLIRMGRGQVAVVTGESGIGRSRLLREFAGRLDRVALARAHEGEAGLAFAPIADLLREALPLIGTELEPAVALEISRILPELPVAGTAPPLDQLGGRDRLFDAVVRALSAASLEAVILDDVQAVSSASADFLSYLLYRLDRLGCLLVLSWRTPGLPGRHPVRVALATGRPGEQATHLPLSRLGTADVAELLTRTGSALDPALVTEHTLGLPLILAETVRAGRVDVLGSGVREVLAARLAEVSEETMQVLAALAVCGGIADQPTLRATSGRGELETVEAIDQALRLGLIGEEGTSVAFTHDALRRVAYEDLSLIRRRLLHARAAETLAAAGPDANPGLVAHHWQLAGRDELAAQSAWTAATRAAALFAHEEALLHLEFVQALGSWEAVGPSRVEVALAEGDALVALGRYEQALAAFSRAASLTAPAPSGSDQTGSDQTGSGQAVIERRRAGVHARIGNWELADRGLAAALEAVEHTPGDHAQLPALLLADRALVALRSGQPDPNGFAAAAAELGPDPYVQNVLGLVALARGDSAAAAHAFETALAEAHDDVLRAAVLNNLARAQAGEDDPDAAVSTARQALALGLVQGDRHRLAALHSNLADRLHEAGDADGAMAEMKLAAALFAEVGTDPLGHPDVWTLTAW